MTTAKEFVWWDNWTSKGSQKQDVSFQIESWLIENKGYQVKQVVALTSDSFRAGGGGYYENCGKVLVVFELINPLPTESKN